VTAGVKGTVSGVGAMAKQLEEISANMQHTMAQIHSSVSELGRVSDNVCSVSDAVTSSTGEIEQFESTVTMLLELAGMLNESWQETKLK
jgi:methyl-accepting chemotaxis protein